MKAHGPKEATYAAAMQHLNRAVGYITQRGLWLTFLTPDDEKGVSWLYEVDMRDGTISACRRTGGEKSGSVSGMSYTDIKTGRGMRQRKGKAAFVRALDAALEKQLTTR